MDKKISLQGLNKKGIKNLWKEFCAIDESKWIDYTGANEQQNYTLNRLNQMPILNDEDLVFQMQCQAAIFHELYPHGEIRNGLVFGTLGKGTKIVTFKKEDFKKELAPERAKITEYNIDGQDYVRMIY